MCGENQLNNHYMTNDNEIFVTPKMSEQFAEVWGEWFRCPKCCKVNILQMDKFCSECRVKLNWSNYK